MSQNSFDFIYICVNVFYTDNTTRKFNFSSQHFSIKRKFFPIENEKVSKPRYDIEFKYSILCYIHFYSKNTKYLFGHFVAFLVKIYIFFYFCCQKCPFQFFKPLKNIFLLRNGCKLQSYFPNNFGWSPNSFDIFWKEGFFIVFWVQVILFYDVFLNILFNNLFVTIVMALVPGLNLLDPTYSTYSIYSTYSLNLPRIIGI